MMLYFDFLSRPIPLRTGKISVLVIENKDCFRKTVKALLHGTAEEEKIVLSEQNRPLKFKSCVQVIQNYMNLDYTAQQMKNIYTDISSFCNAEMREETLCLSQAISEYLEHLNEEFDFDFSYGEQLYLPDLLKMKAFKPDQSSKNPIEALLDYMLLLQKYSGIKCFILLTPHVFFETNELEILYKELLNRNISVLVLESDGGFERCVQEQSIILDKDLCEIVAVQE